jgi:AraC-like DNA-binding protein
MYSLQTTEMPEHRPTRATARSAPARQTVRDLAPLRFEPDSTRRAQLGQIGVDLRTFGRQHGLQLTPNATTVHLVIPIAGAAVAVSHQDSRQIAPGVALLLTKRQRTDFVWTAESSGLILHIPLALLQQSVATTFPEPRRLAATAHAFELGPSDDGLAEQLLTALRLVEGAKPTLEPAADRRIAENLIAVLRSADENEFFPVSRSLQRASDFLMANPDTRCSPGELASIAGVTLPTLQRNVKTCLGIPLAKFVEQVRLTWVRAQLESPMEGRSMARLADACGYRTAATLARAYQRLFGETPTQTRARAFAATSR